MNLLKFLISKVPRSLIPNKSLLLSLGLHVFAFMMLTVSMVLSKMQLNFISSDKTKSNISVGIMYHSQIKDLSNAESLSKVDIKTKDGTESIESSEEQQQDQEQTENLEEVLSENLNNLDYITQDEDGVYVVENPNVHNIRYNIISFSEPSFPSSLTRMSLGTVIIKTRFLVNLEGKIELLEIIEHNVDANTLREFEKEIKKAMEKWQFSPIFLDREPVKVYFYKDFKFIM